jgi:predicted transposase
MILLRTVKIFLTNAKEQLLPTAIAYTNAYNYACQDGYDGKITSGYDLHKRTYQTIVENAVILAMPI